MAAASTTSLFGQSYSIGEHQTRSIVPTWPISAWTSGSTRVWPTMSPASTRSRPTISPSPRGCASTRRASTWSGSRSMRSGRSGGSPARSSTAATRSSPLLGLEHREGVLSSASYRLNTNWTANAADALRHRPRGFLLGLVRRVLSRRVLRDGRHRVAELFGVGQQGYSVTKVMFQLSLRTLGDVNFSQKFDPASETQ